MYRKLKEDNFGDVGRFHTKFGLPNVNDDPPGPREFCEDLMQFRLNFLLEELKELMESMDAYFSPSSDAKGEPTVKIELEGAPEVDHAKAFDALLDLVYVALGTAHLMGYPWDDGWDRVQRANMTKVRAQSDGSDSKRGSSFDVVKPKGWTPPDIEGLLQSYGWDINQ